MKRIHLITACLNLTLFLSAQPNNLSPNIDQLIQKGEIAKERTIVKAISHPDGDTLRFIDIRNNQFDINKLNIPVTDYTRTKASSKKKPLVTLNGNLIVSESFLSNDILNKDLIDDFLCVSSIVMDGTVYAPYINITLKDNYIPKVISLSRIKEKYTHLKDQPVIFQINKKPIITQEYDDFTIDEQNISKITIDTSIKNKKEGISTPMINLYTRTNKEKTIEQGKIFDYLQDVGKLIATKERKTAKSIHLNQEKELSLIDFRKNTIEKTEADTIVRVSVFFEENNNWKEDGYTTLNNSLLANYSLSHKNVLDKRLIKDICQCGMLALDSDPAQRLRKHTQITLSDNSYIPKTLSLASIEKRYIDADDHSPIVFLIDGQIIFTNEYDNFFVDGNNLSKITIEKLCQSKKEQVTMINLLTKCGQKVN